MFDRRTSGSTEVFPREIRTAHGPSGFSPGDAGTQAQTGIQPVFQARCPICNLLRCFIPRRSMYDMYAYIGMVWGVNVSTYSIHGVYGIGLLGWMSEVVQTGGVTICVFSPLIDPEPERPLLT